MIKFFIYIIIAISIIGLLAGIYKFVWQENKISANRDVPAKRLYSLATDIPSARLYWQKNIEPDMLYYTVYRGTKTGEYSKMATVSHPDTSIVVDSVAVNTAYFFVVTATDTAGNESGYSNEVEFTVFDTTGQNQSITDGFNSFNSAVWERGTNTANLTIVENGVLALRSNAREAGWVHTVNRFPLRNCTVDVYFAKTGGSCNVGFSPTVRSESVDGIVSEMDMVRVYVAHVSAITRGIYLQEKKNDVVTKDTLLISDERFQTLPVALRLNFSETAMQISYMFDGDISPSGDVPPVRLYQYQHPISDIYRLGSFIELSSYFTLDWGEAHIDSFVLRPVEMTQNRFDFTKDSIVDIFDWIFLLRHIGIKSDGGEYLPELDLNEDGWIDGMDKALFARLSGFV